MRTDTEDLPILERGILKEDPKRATAYWIVRALILTAMVAATIVALMSATGCAGTVGHGVRAPDHHVIPQPGPAPDPLYAYLVYGVLCGILGVGVSVAMFIWLPFKRTAIALGGGSIGIIAICLLVRSVLPYIGWVVLGGLALGAVVALIHARKIIAKLQEAWEHVPESAPTSVDLDRFMAKVVKSAVKPVLPSVPAAGYSADDGMGKA